MLYFSKLKLVSIYFVIVFLSLLSLANFFENEDNILLSKKVNLGLDLQGGSYLLLEVDSQPVIKQRLQDKVLLIRKALKKQKIKYKNLQLQNETISFQLLKGDIKRFEDFFLNKNNSINIYYTTYRSYEMDYFIKNMGTLSPGEDLVTITYSKFGLIEIKNSILDDSLEIVRRRIDEVGTKEPTIIRRGNDRILIELPGLDDPNRIKNLLGKTANLTFRLVSETEDSFGSELLFYEDGDNQLNVNKRVILSEIDIPFRDIVKLLVKWSLASIPALIVVSLVLCLLALIGYGFYFLLIDASTPMTALAVVAITLGIGIGIYALTLD